MSDVNNNSEMKQSISEEAGDSVIPADMAEQHKIEDMEKSKDAQQPLSVQVLKTCDVRYC